MYELVVWVTDKNTGKRTKVEKSFNSSGQMAAFYNSQPGKSIEREIDSLYRGPKNENKKSN